jgi:hypothetical protein
MTPMPMAAVVSRMVRGDMDDVYDFHARADYYGGTAVTSVFLVDKRAAGQETGGGYQDGG